MRKIALLATCALVGFGCGENEPLDEAVVTPVQPVAGWLEVSEVDLSPPELDQFQRAKAAQKEMAGTLMGELKAELASGGPAGAVDVCRDLAPTIAEHVSHEHGLAIGRTSHRLRNASNVPPQWAEDRVAAGKGEKVLFRGPSGELGVLHPIKIAPPCLACHGPAERLDETVAGALAESYPNDEAVGFAEGDLRGWFWVEVPGNSSPTG